MSPSKLTLSFIAGVLFVFSSALFAQSGGGQSQGEPSVFRNGESKGTTQEQIKELGDYMDKAKSLNRNELKNLPPKDVQMSRAKLAVSTLKLPCTVKDAELASTQVSSDKGKEYLTDLLEVACADNTGYIIRTHERYSSRSKKADAPKVENTNAITCFAAEATKLEDEEKGIKSELFCQLPDNGGGDIKTLASRLLTGAGVACNVSQFKWFGVDEAVNTEINELACEGGTGYLLHVALPGSKSAPSAMNCVEAGTKSIECKLTKVFVKPNIKTFKDYLAKTSVDCKVDDYAQINVIGRESIKQRYIIEFKCAQQPKGLVALIPLHDNIHPFETIDCAAAKQRGMVCKLTVVN
jgi:hypothetical protein